MPGIAGFIRRHWSPVDNESLAQMRNALCREPFDTTGSHIDAQNGLGIAWSLHRGSFADCLPAWNETRTLCLFGCGEDFIDTANIESLKARGHQLTPGNASYLVHQYEEVGEKFFAHLNGNYCGVVLDLPKQQVHLFSDRFGLNRIYIHETEDATYFASEAKCLLKVLPQLREIDLDSLGEWMSCGCPLQNRTLFRGVGIMPNSSVWTFNAHAQARKRTYFNQQEWEQIPALSAEDYAAQLREVFPRIVGKYLHASQPIAMSLTGGLDGRMIMAWSDRRPGELPCYTFNGPYRDCEDMLIGRRIATKCGQPHHVVQVGDRFLQEFPALAEKSVLVSDGAMDVTGAVELYANRLAREIAPIRLTGNYGSEIIRGNVAFGPGKLSAGLFTPALGAAIEKASATYAAERAGSALAFIAFKQVPWHHFARLSVEQSQLTMRSPYLDNDLVKLAFMAPPELRTAPRPSHQLIAAGRGELMQIPTDRGVVYPPIPGYTRLRRQWEEVLIKFEYAFDYGMPQSFAKLVGRWLPRPVAHAFLGRQKFYHMRTWYQYELAPYLREILLDSKTLSRPWYQPRFVEHMVQTHTLGSRNYTNELHKVLTLELLQRQLLDRS